MRRSKTSHWNVIECSPMTTASPSGAPARKPPPLPVDPAHTLPTSAIIMLRNLKNIVDAGRLCKTVGDLEKRVGGLKKAQEKTASQSKGYGEKFTKSRQEQS